MDLAAAGFGTLLCYAVTRSRERKRQQGQWTAKFISFLKKSDIRCIVFDMDHTMSAFHCGEGIRKAEQRDYIRAASKDFVALASALAVEPKFRLAVATGSDPAEYELPGQSRETHILGPDLATALINQNCPAFVLPRFEIMVGYDYRLHGKKSSNRGKRYHMRKISKFYNIPFEQMLIIDDSISSLKNEDGWHGMLVHDRSIGLSRLDILKYINCYGSGIEQLEHVVDSVLERCPWTSQTKVNAMISFTESEIIEVKEELAVDRINEADLEEELGDLMFDVLLLLKICERDFDGKVSYNRALQRCAKKIRDRCPHVFGRETARTKEEAHAIWKRVKREQKRAKECSASEISGGQC